jgi:thiol-disulfide isomerase/thioredoxin
MKSIFLGLLCSLFYFTAAAQTPATLMPGFKFYTESNAGFTKDDIPSGRQSLIVFFDGTCGHCQSTMTQLSKQSAALANVNIYLISLDEFRTMNYFVDRYGKPFLSMKNVKMLQDKDRIFIPLFKPLKYPSIYLYSADKRLKIYSSDEQDIPKIMSLLKN